MRFRTRIALSPPDDVVRITMHRNLCEMRDHDDLMSAGEMRDDLGKRDGNSAAHTSIDLVKYERVDIVIRSQHNFDSQHDAADLATRRDTCKRPRLHAGARPIEEFELRWPGLRP